MQTRASDSSSMNDIDGTRCVHIDSVSVTSQVAFWGLSVPPRRTEMLPISVLTSVPSVASKAKYGSFSVVQNALRAPFQFQYFCAEIIYSARQTHVTCAAAAHG
jgi:hypothetical protein